MTFRDGFQEDWSTYKRHDRYKEEMIQAAEKVVESKFKEMLAQMAEQQQICINPLQVGQQQSSQMVMMSLLVLAQANTTCAQSSVALTIAQPYPVDCVSSTTPCMLLYPIGRARKTKEVAKAHVDPIGDLFEGKPIPSHACECRSSRNQAMRTTR